VYSDDLGLSPHDGGGAEGGTDSEQEGGEDVGRKEEGVVDPRRHEEGG
jgi:hypothetical protein